MTVTRQGAQSTRTATAAATYVGGPIAFAGTGTAAHGGVVASLVISGQVALTGKGAVAHAARAVLGTALALAAHGVSAHAGKATIAVGSGTAPSIPADIVNGTPASKCFGWAANTGPALTGVDNFVAWKTQFGMTGVGGNFGTSQGFKAVTLESQPFYFYFTGTDTSNVPDPLSISASYSTKFNWEHAYMGYGVPSVNGGTYGTVLTGGFGPHGVGPKRMKDLDPTYNTYLTIKQRNTGLPPVNPYCGDWWNDSVWAEWVRFFKNFAAGLVLLNMDGFQWDWESSINTYTNCTSTTRPASPLMGCVIHETDTGLYYRWNGSWVSTNLTELQTLIESRGHQVGQAIFSVYPNCNNIHYGWIPRGSIYDYRYATSQGRVAPNQTNKAHDWYLWGMMRAQTEAGGTGYVWEWDQEYYRNGGFNGSNDTWSQLTMSTTCSFWSQDLPAATRDWMMPRLAIVCPLWYNGGTAPNGTGGSWPDIGEGGGAAAQNVHHRRSMHGARSVYHMGSQQNNGPDDWPMLQTDHTVSSYTYSGTNPPGGHQAGLLAAASTTPQDVMNGGGANSTTTIGTIGQSRSGSTVTLTCTAANDLYGIYHVHWTLYASNAVTVADEGEGVQVYVANGATDTPPAGGWPNAFVNCTVTIPNATAGLYVILDFFTTIGQRTSRRVQLT